MKILLVNDVASPVGGAELMTLGLRDEIRSRGHDIRVFGGRVDIGAFEAQPVSVNGDFNDDGIYDCLDIDALVAEIAAATNGLAFDLTGDRLADLTDRDAWLAEAGEINLGPGKVYLLADANLDSYVDGLDFIIWNANKFTSLAEWCAGDFNADGLVDDLDFILWNDNKFQSSNGVNQIALAKPADGRHLTDHARQTQTSDQPNVDASSLTPRLAPSTVKRIDSVFATSHRSDEPSDERPDDHAFRLLGDSIPIKSWVL